MIRNEASASRFFLNLHWVVLSVVLLIGCLIRASVIFRNELIPAVNGAYYLVQARSILRTGWLGLPDFPLLFYIHALLGKILSFFMPLDEALLMGVRFADTVFPAMCAIPIFFFSRAFESDGKTSRNCILATLLVGLLAVGYGSLLRMIGDFQKNSFALPLFLFYSFYLYASFRNPQGKNYFLSCLFFVLICLTHLGTTAMTMAFTACFFSIHFFTYANRKRMILLGVLFAGLSILALILVSFYDPVRVGRLGFAAMNPLRLFRQSILFQTLQGAGGPPNELPGLLLGNCLGIVGLIVVFRNRSILDSSTKTLLLSGSLCSLFFASFLIHADLSSRFGLMAHIPGLIPLLYFVRQSRWGVWVGGIAATAALLHTVAFSFQIHPTLSKFEYDELIDFKSVLPAGKNLILTKHGLEWWVAWTMETQIARTPGIVLDAWDRYDAAFEIVEISSGPNQKNQPPTHPGSPSKPPGRQIPGDRLSLSRSPGDDRPPPEPPSGMTPFFESAIQKPSGLFHSNSQPEFQKSLVREGRYFQLYRLERKKEE